MELINSSSAAAGMNMIPRLPDDLVIDILLMVPVTSVLRFTCVSKSWKRLLSSRQFREQHLVSKSRNSRLTFQEKHTHKRKHCAFFDDDASATIAMLNSPTPYITTRAACGSLLCVASGDGLLLFAVNHKISNKRLLLWNPSTRKFKRLPPLFPDDNHVPEPTGYCNYGLGYDESSHQFKVIGFTYNERDKYNVVVKIYSLKDKGPWRRIKDHTGFSLFRSSFSNGKSTLCANRKIYWIGEHPLQRPRRSPLTNWEIAYLDLETEEHGILQRPESVSNLSIYASLVFSQGLLYLWCQPSSRSYADVWIIEQPGYGKLENSTWTKVVQVPLEQLQDNNPQKRLLHVWSDGPQVLFLSGSRFVIFNNKDSSFTFPDIANANLFAKTFTYVESLISP